MRKVPNSDTILLINVSDVWALVVHSKSKNTMLVRNFERSDVGGIVRRSRCRKERNPIVWIEHGELELEAVARGNLEGGPAVDIVLRKLYFKSLQNS